MADTRSHFACFIPIQKATPPSFWAAAWAGGHTYTKWLHPDFLWGVSSQGPLREPSVGPAHHTPSPSHPQISTCRRTAHTSRKPGAPACPALLLRLSLREPRGAARLTSGLCCPPERWLASSPHCCRQHCCCGRDVRVSAFPQEEEKWFPQQVLPNKVIKPYAMHLDSQEPTGPSGQKLRP